MNTPITRNHHTAPRGEHTEATLDFTRGASSVHILPEQAPDRLFTAQFTGRQPTVSVTGGTVSIRYPVGPNFRTGGEVTLNPDLSWTIRIQDGAVGLDADLTRVGLSAIDVDGGASRVTLHLPRPDDVIIPVHISGGASRVTILRPTGVATRLYVRKGAAELAFDKQRFGAVGGEVQLESPPVAGSAGRYDITIGSGASHLTVTTT
jgi:hypothetical protein